MFSLSTKSCMCIWQQDPAGAEAGDIDSVCVRVKERVCVRERERERVQLFL